MLKRRQIYRHIWKRDFTHQVYEGRGGGPPDQAAAGQAGQAEGADGDAEQEDGEGVGEVGLNSQVLVQPEIDSDRANQQHQGVDLKNRRWS